MKNNSNNNNKSPHQQIKQINNFKIYIYKKKEPIAPEVTLGKSQSAAAQKNEAGERAELTLSTLDEITHSLRQLLLCCSSFKMFFF